MKLSLIWHPLLLTEISKGKNTTELKQNIIKNIDYYVASFLLSDSFFNVLIGTPAFIKQNDCM